MRPETFALTRYAVASCCVYRSDGGPLHRHKVWNGNDKLRRLDRSRRLHTLQQLAAVAVLRSGIRRPVHFEFGVLRAMTRCRFLISILAAWAIQANAADSLPTELVGEWATEQSEFSRSALSKGAAIYLTAQGVGALIGAPPPIGALGPATYDPKTRTLTLRLTERGQVMATCGFIYDSKLRTLKGQGTECGTDVFKRRRNDVPDYILKMLK